MRELIHLVVFLSRGTPLARWENMGIYTRETSIFKQLAERLGKLSLVTSGGVEELTFLKDLSKAASQHELQIDILYNRWGFSPNLYSLLAPILHQKELRLADIYRTNQLDGAWTAILAKWLFHKPVIVRAGYLWSELHQKEHFSGTTNGQSMTKPGRVSGQGLKAAMIDRLQSFAFQQASAVMVTTPAMADYVMQQYSLAPSRVRVVPNYVETEIFRPMPEIERVPGQVCFVGRMNTMKNLESLVQAVGQISGASLVIIGDSSKAPAGLTRLSPALPAGLTAPAGDHRQRLEEIARQFGTRIHFKGVLPNDQVPQEINRSQVFVLPSFSEGHPKAMIEAMACGAAVVGTDVEGIREIIRQGETGLLCDPSPSSIQRSIQTLLQSPELAEHLGQAARQYVIERFALETVTGLEETLIRQLLHRK